MDTGLPQGNWGKETPEEQKARESSYNNVEYLTLANGPNLLRFIGSYIFRHMHYYEAGKRPHIVCIGADRCPLCQMGFTPNFYYYCNVVYRAGGEDKLMVFRFGPGIKKKLDGLATKYGSLDKYDIEIVREGTGQDTRYPSILPELMNTKPLSDAVMVSIRTKLADLADIYKIPTLEEVRDSMQPKSAEDRRTSNNQAQQPVQQYTPPPAQQTPPPQREMPSGLQGGEAKKTIIPLAIGKAEKACYGDHTIYNPQRPECSTCRLMHAGCKDRVLAHYTGETIVE